MAYMDEREVLKHIIQTDGNCKFTQKMCWSCLIRAECRADNWYWLGREDDKGDFTFRRDLALALLTDEEIVKLFL